MPKPLTDLRILLIQARNTHVMEVQEQGCFSDRCRIDTAQFRLANVVRDALSPDLLEDVDALMIGGAGEYSAHKSYPWMDDLLALIRTAYDRYLPTFGSCWGHQVIARAFGGEVRYDPDRAEFGCGTILLTEAGRNDVLFRGFPAQFSANMGHQDRVVTLPPNAVELAYNDGQRNQAFRIKDRPIYGTQFHSELDARTMEERLLTYRGLYEDELGGEDGLQQILASLTPTTEVDHLLSDFLRVFVCSSD